jgi:uracil-DNA glycosylase
MSLNLDPRQRAMLAEIGVRVWTAPPTTQVITPAAVAPPQAAVATQSVAAPAIKSSSTAPKLIKPHDAVPTAVAALEWPALQQTVVSCQACALCQSRRNTVFGAGDLQADWLVVGDPPQEDEDQQGKPFVGNDGQLLDNMLKAVGLQRDRPGLYITNALKCRPPGNRNPEAGEVAQCAPYLQRQIELLQPKIILAMGRFAVQSLLQSTEPIGKLRGRVHHYPVGETSVPLVVTYHPAYLLRNLPDKAKAWADLCLALQVVQGGA